MMAAAVDEWFEALQHNLPTPMGPAQLDDWLRLQARVPYASVRNTILLCGQCPTVTELRTYDGWAAATSGPDAPALRGASALWLWDPVVARQCPGCGRGEFDHDTETDDAAVPCTDVAPHRWAYAVVKTIPTPLFAREQLATRRDAPTGPAASTVGVRPPTAGPDNHHPDLSEAGDATPDPGRLPVVATPSELVALLEAMATTLPLTLAMDTTDSFAFIDPAVVTTRDTYTLTPTVKANPTAPPEDLATALLRAYSKVLVAPDITAHDELRRRALEADAITYAAAIALGHGRRFDLPVDPPHDLDRWGHDSVPTLQTRCARIQEGLAQLLEAAIAAPPQPPATTPTRGDDGTPR
jgi:hypothetical protein